MRRSTTSCGSFNFFFPVFIHIPIHYCDYDEYYYFRTDELDAIYEGVRGGLFLFACSHSSLFSFFKKKKGERGKKINLSTYLWLFMRWFGGAEGGEGKGGQADRRPGTSVGEVKLPAAGRRGSHFLLSAPSFLPPAWKAPNPAKLALPPAPLPSSR